MQGKDFKNRIKQIIKEEVSLLLKEETYKFGKLADPKKMDPNDPMVKVTGFASMNRSSIRGTDESYQAYKQLQDLISDSGILYKLIGAELDTANQLEATRLKGGRRTITIPKQ